MIKIFTDGSSRGNPGPGGFGAIIEKSDEIFEIGGREKETTNNRMELMASISALEAISKERDIVVYTDSAYLVSGITRWVKGWERNGWKTSQKENVLNVDLWQRLLSVTLHKVIDWKLIKGHSGNPGNERCDVIATSFADNNPVSLYKGPKTSYQIDLRVTENTKPSRSKKAYSYISSVDGIIEVHKTWEECKERVNGKSLAKYKKSVSPEDEEKIIEEFRQ